MQSYSKKEQMIFDAVLCLMKQGVDIYTVKVQDIATAAGIGKGTLYEYFPSKEAIILQTLSYFFAQELDFFQNALKTQLHFDAVIEQLLHYCAHNAAPIIPAFQAILSNPKTSQAMAKELIEPYRARFVRVASELIALGRKDGVIADTCTEEYCLFVIRTVSTHLVSQYVYNHIETQEYVKKLLRNAFQC